MIEGREQAIRNRFITHWREIDSGKWIDSNRRKPTKQDADEYDCVISRNRWDEVSMAGWHRFEAESTLTGWQRPPEPPEGYEELRRNAE